MVTSCCILAAMPHESTTRRRRPATRERDGPSGRVGLLATSHIRTARIARAREHPRPLSPASSAPHESSDREAEVGHASRHTADHSRPSLDPPQSPRPSLIVDTSSSSLRSMVRYIVARWSMRRLSPLMIERLSLAAGRCRGLNREGCARSGPFGSLPLRQSPKAPPLTRITMPRPMRTMGKRMFSQRSSTSAIGGRVATNFARATRTATSARKTMQ